MLARRALPLTEVVRLAVKAGWDHLIVDGVNIPTERVNGRIGRKQPWYSGKHKRHGGSGTTIAAPDGELLWVSGLLPGRTVDIRAARRFRIADKVLAHLVRPKPPCAASANERTPSSSAGKSWPATSAATPDRSRWSSRPS
ncbi:transposase family protein [Streptomyces brevispora]|uniref:transposase family protein n=1 Tax=Streptomyces brevispora TaxID=887462 RepID=UPI0035D9DD8D